MGNILKLIQLDKALLKPYYKYFLIVFIVPGFLIFDYKSFAPSLIFAMTMMAMTCNYTFSIAEKNDLNRLYGLLPISKKDIVTGRYMFTALLGMASLAITTVLAIIILTIIKVHLSTDDIITGIGVGLIFYSIFTAIQLPGFFRYGAIKGRFFTFIPLIGIFLVSFTAKSIGKAISFNINSIGILNSPLGMLIISILTAVVVYGISIKITQKVYGKMEL